VKGTKLLGEVGRRYGVEGHDCVDDSGTNGVNVGSFLGLKMPTSQFGIELLKKVSHVCQLCEVCIQPQN